MDSPCLTMVGSLKNCLTQGALYVDNENGRKDAAKKAVFNGKEGQKVFGMLDDLNKAGALGKYGASWDDIRAALQSGQVCVFRFFSRCS